MEAATGISRIGEGAEPKPAFGEAGPAIGVAGELLRVALEVLRGAGKVAALLLAHAHVEQDVGVIGPLLVKRPQQFQ